jgi:nitrite reductase/ring-hydroxylating ferredoxin subunit
LADDRLVDKDGADTGWVFAAKLDAVPENGVFAKVIDGAGPLLFSRIGGVLNCFRNYCPHAGFTIDGGRIANGAIGCPHHGLTFDLVSGECLNVRQVYLVTHPMRLSGDQIEVRLRE